MTLSLHEAVVWWEFQHGLSTAEIAEKYAKPRKAPEYVRALFESAGKKEREARKVELKDAAYVSRVLNRAREKIERVLMQHANSHRLDVESVQDYKGLLIGFDYQASAQVYIIFTMKDAAVVWYTHDSYAGKLCPDCPKNSECRDVLDTIVEEYDIRLREDQEQLYMTEQSTAIFHKLSAKEIPRYRRKREE